MKSFLKGSNVLYTKSLKMFIRSGLVLFLLLFSIALWIYLETYNQFSTVRQHYDLVVASKQRMVLVQRLLYKIDNIRMIDL